MPQNTSLIARLYCAVVGLVTLLFGLALAHGGFKLLSLGGSAYYLPIGLALAVAGALLIWRDVRGAWLYAAVLAVTALWAPWEAGWRFWPLAARLGMPAVLGALIALATPALRGAGPRTSRGRPAVRRVTKSGQGVLQGRN